VATTAASSRPALVQRPASALGLGGIKTVSTKVGPEGQEPRASRAAIAAISDLTPVDDYLKADNK
jgi:hypothetical protein